MPPSRSAFVHKSVAVPESKPRELRILDVAGQIPAMPDAELTSLLANAVRLGQHGTAAQRKAAALLTPAIEAELASRRQAREAAAPPRRTPRRRPAVADAGDPSA